jgi:quercetin dioxygenase-like cupin family protein
MNTPAPTSSCDIAPAPANRHGPGPGSRVLRFQEGFRWQGVAVAEYKQPAANWCGIVRQILVGESGEATGFDVRYFEIAPGGFSSLEEHAHTHAVFVLRGRGRVRLAEEEHDLSFGDVVYVAPHEWHRFANAGADEPFGFLCLIDARRDLSLADTPPRSLEASG